MASGFSYMKDDRHQPLVISGVGVTTAVGQRRFAFTDALLAGRSAFRVMTRPGRQFPANDDGTDPGSTFIGAEIDALKLPDELPAQHLRTASFSSQVALATLYEAWHDAELDRVDPMRIGLIAGGSNFQQRELVVQQDTYRSRARFLRPTYAMSFMDSDLTSLCSEVFDIRGLAYTLGGASASGQLAVIQAAEAVRSGAVDVCIALGALMDLSYWECQSFRSIGAMGSDRYADSPAHACRPYDKDRDGFIFGESCGAVVVQKASSAAHAYARIESWARVHDANRNPNPSADGEIRVIRQAMREAGCYARDIDYINPHGTGSAIGDETELEALHECGLNHAWINATKSILGHGLSAAGIVEIIATIVQMESRMLHPTRNLDRPMSDDFRWVGRDGNGHAITRALNLSMGFGGVNSAMCLASG
jgi:malonyl-ACP decarboxylase